MNTTTKARRKILLVRLVVAGSIVTLPAGLAAGPAVASIAAPAVVSAAASTGPLPSSWSRFAGLRSPSSV
ncbi:hypothetical protein [Rhodococcus sp. JS3073]|uniref:hypothetical protein n=1 Tax=Rhodococcus sp. JS3073 TaxID=3002901 RepID=UPI002285E77B|nr:hypothetical protein [Rhodococcus sp. JS3073]WAM14586.1 hypothetical protein OYT95_35135 [Rhodococcus sp. JS3073]